MKKTIAGLASTFAFFASMTAANAEPVTVVFLSNFAVFDLSSIIDGNGITRYNSGLYDRAAGVYCENRSFYDASLKNLTSNEIVTVNLFCKQVDDAEVRRYIGDNVVTHPYTPLMEVSAAIDKSAQTVIETETDINPNAPFRHEIKRTWDFANNKVCLNQSRTNKNGEINYESDMGGCYNIPNNSHANTMRQKLSIN